jgi:uncharacterized protein (DUF58 family)
MRAPFARLEETFPLVPRHRQHGLELGPFQSVRRGPGSDVAGSRPYRPGDDVRSIDWGASARLSAARGSDEFVVRERYAEQAPRIVLVVDRRPAMSLYPEPWLDKEAALQCAIRLIGESGLEARGLVGWLSIGADATDWRPPQGNPTRWRTRPVEIRFDGPEDGLARAFEHLQYSRALTAGSFVFVLSDFLAPPPEEELVAAVARGWDVVPVVVQDPLWEASFPEEVGGLVLPLEDPVTHRLTPVRLSRREARERRAANEHRLAELVRRYAELELDPVVLTSDDPGEILQRFLEWSEARLAPVGRVA